MRIISIVGTDFTGINPNWDRKPFTDNGRLQFDRTRVEDWANLYYELGDLARIPAIAIGIRGAYPGDDYSTNWCWPAREAWLQARIKPALCPWFDTVGLPDMVNPPNVTLADSIPFDFGNDEHLDIAWERYARVFFDAFAGCTLERTDESEHVIVPWWGIDTHTGWGFVNQRLCQRLLDFIDDKLFELGISDAAAHIVDKTWLQYAPSLQCYAAHNWFNPWTSPPESYSMRGHSSGHKVGVAVPSFYEIINPDGNAHTIHRALDTFVEVGIDIALIESGNNFSEQAELMRDATGNTHKLDAVRAFTQPLQPPSQESTMLTVYQALSRKNAIPHPVHANKFTMPHPDGDGTVISVQPGGGIEKRPAGTSGAFETFYDDGRTAVYDEVEPGIRYAILLVD